MSTLNEQQQRIAALIASGGATQAQQIPADLTAPPGQPQYQRLDTGGLQQAAQNNGTIQGKELLEFIKPFLQPEPAKTGSQALAERLFETLVNETIQGIGDQRRLFNSLTNRVIDREARKELGLPASDGSRVKHTIADRSS
jgi:hypothetical protein